MSARTTTTRWRGCERALQGAGRWWSTCRPTTRGSDACTRTPSVPGTRSITCSAASGASSSDPTVVSSRDETTSLVPDVAGRVARGPAGSLDAAGADETNHAPAVTGERFQHLEHDVVVVDGSARERVGHRGREVD